MSSDTPEENREVGPYRLLHRMAGSSREVFLAESAERGRVVLKIYGAPTCTLGPFDPQIPDAAIFYAQLAHPNIVKILDLFSTDGQFVIALEHVEGQTLDVIGGALERGELALDDDCCLYIGSCIFSALAAAHESTDADDQPMLHRNMNPSNVHVTKDGAVKVGNFNVAPVVRVTRDSSPGIVWGSYGYFAPEQVRLQPLDTRCDVYSAMLVVRELLTRKKAIQRGALQDFEILKEMAAPTFESIDVVRPDLDARVRELVGRGLAIDPNARPTAAEAARVLQSAMVAKDARARLAKALDPSRTAPREEVVSVHDAVTVAPPPAEDPPAARTEKAPTPPVPAPRPKAPPLPPRPKMQSLPTARAFPPPLAAPLPEPAPWSAVVPPLPVAPQTPHPLAMDVDRESPVVAPVRRRSVAPLAAVAVLAVVLGFVLITLVARRHAPVAASASAVTSVASASVAPTVDTPVAAPVASAAPSTSSAPTTSTAPTNSSSSTGELVPPASAAGHRIYVDGRVLGEGTKPIRVACGRHLVRVGSGGRARAVDVPCGDSLSL